MANKFLDPSVKSSINQKFREKRFSFFISLLETIKSDNIIRILDIGGTESYWNSMQFDNSRNVEITLLNLQKEETNLPHFKSIAGDACDLSQFKDGEFDIVFSNSVIEHLFTAENQQRMAAEVRRVGKNYYIQTPNYFFPIEPHWLFPCFQFLPFRLRIFLTKNFNLGHYSKSVTIENAVKRVSEVKLLTEKEMKKIFPESKVYHEMFFGLVKSLTAYNFSGV